MVKIRPTVIYCCQSNNGQAFDTQSIDQKNVYKKKLPLNIFLFYRYLDSSLGLFSSRMVNGLIDHFFGNFSTMYGLNYDVVYIFSIWKIKLFSKRGPCTGVSKWAGTRYFYPSEIVYITGRNYCFRVDPAWKLFGLMQIRP